MVLTYYWLLILTALTAVCQPCSVLPEIYCDNRALLFILINIPAICQCIILNVHSIYNKLVYPFSAHIFKTGELCYDIVIIKINKPYVMVKYAKGIVMFLNLKPLLINPCLYTLFDG